VLARAAKNLHAILVQVKKGKTPPQALAVNCETTLTTANPRTLISKRRERIGGADYYTRFYRHTPPGAHSHWAGKVPNVPHRARHDK